WFRGHRRDHLVHQHLQPGGDAGRRPVGEEGCRQGAEIQAMGEDLAGPGLQGGHRLPRTDRPADRTGQARFLPGRLRLHHLHRQLRSAAAGNQQGDQRRRPHRRAVISGNRNFEGRVHAEVKMNYLASPPLVVAYALAGSLDVNLSTDPLGHDKDGKDVFLKDIWPTNQEISDLMASAVTSEMFKKNYADVFKGDERWAAIDSPDGALYAWDEASTYIKNPPYFDGMTMALTPVEDIHAARCLG